MQVASQQFNRKSDLSEENSIAKIGNYSQNAIAGLIIVLKSAAAALPRSPDQAQGEEAQREKDQREEDHVRAVVVQQGAAPPPNDPDTDKTRRYGSDEQRRGQEQQHAPVLRSIKKALQDEEKIAADQQEPDIIPPPFSISRKAGMTGDVNSIQYGEKAI